MTHNLTLTKKQKEQVLMAISRMPLLGADYAARCLSGLYRSARRESQQIELLSIARAYKLISNPEFII